MSVQELIDYGFLNFVDYKNNLLYLEFVYTKDKTYRQYIGQVTETYNYLGTIFCDKEGNIIKATVKSYCISLPSNELIIGLPQLINKSQKIKISDIFKVDDNNTPYIDLVTVKETITHKQSNLWAGNINSNWNFATIRMQQPNFSTREYIEETQEKIKTAEFFNNEREKFNILANSIVTGSKNIERGLGYVAGAIQTSVDRLATVHAYDEGNSYFWCGGSHY